MHVHVHTCSSDSLQCHFQVCQAAPDGVHAPQGQWRVGRGGGGDDLRGNEQRTSSVVSGNLIHVCPLVEWPAPEVYKLGKLAGKISSGWIRGGGGAGGRGIHMYHLAIVHVDLSFLKLHAFVSS